MKRVDAEQLYEWREALHEIDWLVAGIRSDHDRQRARELVDKLEREIFESYLDTNAAEVRCACNVATPEARTVVDVQGAAE